MKTVHRKLDIRPGRTVVTTRLTLQTNPAAAATDATACEAHSFSRLTYYPDRPDNMAVFALVRLEADRDLCPLLLSNGNLVESGVCDSDNDENDKEDSDSSAPRRHYAVWSDPFPKPSYLFAVVAGSLGMLQGTYMTKSGRIVQLTTTKCVLLL